MHKIICRAVKGEITPLQLSKVKLLQNIIDSYESLDKKFIITIESVEKDINNSQVSLYKAFILKASNEYGCTYSKMEHILTRFQPIDINTKENNPKPLDKWNTQELNSFIDQASELLSGQGFKF